MITLVSCRFIEKARRLSHLYNRTKNLVQKAIAHKNCLKITFSLFPILKTTFCKKSSSMDGEKAEQGTEAGTTAEAASNQTPAQPSAPVAAATSGAEATDASTAIYHEEEEEEQEQKSVDLTETHFKYTKLRTAFGKQPQFLEDRPRIHCGLRANTSRYHPLFQQQSKVDKGEDTLEALRDLTTNTSRAEYRAFSVLHTEGGWPREINLRESEIVEKTRRKLQREESFMDAVPNLAREAEYLVKHNNTLGLCEPLNKRPYVQKRDTKPNASVIAVYKCPSVQKRPVSRITFAPGNAARMAVVYCPYEFDPTFREHSCEAFFWEVDNPTRPEGLVRSAAQIVDIKYHPTDVHSVCGALFTGQVCTWDNRVGPNPQAISNFENSHEDVCTNAVWSNGDRGAHEFFSTGLDGGIIWWDERNLSSRLDAVYADINIGRNDPKQAVPITTLEYDHKLRNKFIIGTQFGQVMPFERKVKKQAAKKSREPSMSQRKRSSAKSTHSTKSAKEGGADEDEDEEEDEEEEEEEETKQEEEEEEEEAEENEDEENDEEEDEEGAEKEEEDDEDDPEGEADSPVLSPPEEEVEETGPEPFHGVTVYAAHRGPVCAIKRNPAFPSNFMSCGGYHLRVYSEDVLESGIMWTSPGDALYSYCQWLTGRPCCLVASRIDGCLEFWDLLIQGSSSILTTKICEEALSAVCPSDNGRHIAAGTVHGDIRMVQVCPFLTTFDNSDRDALGQLFYREARREQHLAERMAGTTAGAGSKHTSKQTSKQAASKPVSVQPPGKPDPYNNPEILADKKFFDMLAEEKRRQGINAFSEKKKASQAYGQRLIEGRMEAKKDAVLKSNKLSDSELGAQQVMDVNDSALKKADAIFDGDMDEEDEDEDLEEDQEERAESFKPATEEPEEDEEQEE